MSFKTDLHIHSWFSDGTMGPSAIVDRYAGSDYDLIAITDHEVLGDVEEAIELGEGRNIRVLQGIELATMNDGIELHILGYYFDTENEELNDALERLAEIRAERRAAEMRAKGDDVNIEDVKKNLLERDYIDSHRETSPLSKAEDAIVLDNSHMTMEDQMVWLKEIIAERFGC